MNAWCVSISLPAIDRRISVVNQLSGAIMNQDSVIPVANNTKSRNDLMERGFSRQPLRIDVDIARSLEGLAHAAWSIPKDKYYDGGDRYRSLNRVRAEIVEGGVKVWPSEENTPYVQLKKYNTTLGGQPREYAPLPAEIAASIGIRKMIAQHCSTSSLPATLGGWDEVLGQRPPNKVHSYAGSTVRHESTGLA
jgi:2OG-Fe dioxygenase